MTDQLLKESIVIYEASEMRKIKLKYHKYKCIYFWYNKITGKIYIGSSLNLCRRLKSYFTAIDSEVKNINSINRLLRNSIKKHELKNFNFGIACEISERSEQFIIEQNYLDRYTPWDRNIGYNISKFSIASKISKTIQGGKLNEKDIIDIFNLLAFGLKPKEIALIYKISPITIRSIRSRISWPDVEISQEILKKIKHGVKMLKEENAMKIGIDLLSGLYSASELAKKYGVTESTISRINLGKTYPKVKKLLNSESKWIWNFVNIHPNKREKVIELLKLGNLTRNKIAVISGVCRPVVEKIRNEMNIPIYKYGN